MRFLISFIIISLFFSFAFCNTLELTEEEKEKLKPQPSHVSSCKEGYPYLSVGDFNLTASNYTSVTKSAKALLVVVTSDDCQHCCKFEEFFQEVKDIILSNKTLMHGLNVKMARATLDENPKLKERIKKVPEFVFYHKDDTYSFEHSYDLEAVGRIMSKIIQPIKTLESYSDFHEFLQKEISFEKGDEKITSLKVVGLYHKNDDLADEMKEFKKTAKKYAIYRDLQFALMTKGNIIENIYRDNGSLWFPPYLKSTVLVVDRKNKVHKVDPTFNIDQLSDQIHLKGKGHVDALTMETQELFRRMRWPLVIAFLDPDNTRDFQSYIEILTEVAKKFEGNMAFAYLNNTKHENKREMMGIYHNKIPAISITLPSSPLLFPYPKNGPINPMALTKFINDFFENKIAPFDPQSIDKKPSNQNKHPIYSSLFNVEEITFQNFNELVMKEGIDVMLLIFKPSEDQNLENLLKNYERVAERFKSLNINSVRIGVYDLTSNPPPPSIEIYTTPMMVFLPAYQKSPPFKVYTDSPKALTLMLYIEKYSDVQFKLPELPHLPPEMHEDYYKQKKLIESDKDKENSQDQADKKQKRTIDFDL